jgi:hypothetical protein
MRRGNFQRRYSPAASPSPSTVALTLAERAQLVESAPTEPGDHLVTLLRPGQPDVFGVVRHDAVGRRLVAVAPTADEAQAKAKPVADRWAPVEPASSAGATGAKAGAPTTQAQKLAAEASLEAERAEYRRACIAAGITAPKLV